MDLSYRHKTLKACIGRNPLKTNQISDLPDDILIHIVSLLTMKEAGKTSVLSKRWRYIWANIPVLNFDASKIIDKLWSFDESPEEEEPSYVYWVDQVVRSHKASTIDEFRVCFDLDEDRKDNIDKWLKFAIEKRVKRLELNIAPFNMTGQWLTYNFPNLSLCNSLTSLELAYVDVTGEFLEKLLYDCQALEVMAVEHSKSLVNLKVAGPSLNLKWLRIKYCIKIKNLEIFAPNLTSCHYYGPKLSSSPFKSTPKLAELLVGGFYGTHMFSSFSDISSCLSQIEVLTLDSVLFKRIAKVFPICTRLKMLHVRVDPTSDKQLFGLRFLLKACPLLQKFILQLDLGDSEIKRSARTRKVESCPLNHLKIVEILAFVGWELDTAFVTYLIENAVSLEKMIIEPTQQSTRWEINVDERRRRAMEQAEKLRPYLKPHTKLEFRESGLRF